MATKSGDRPAGARDCQEYAVELSAYFDGELKGDAKAVLERHIETCEPCRKRLDGMARLRVALSALAQPGSKRRGSVMDLLKEKLASGAGSGPKKPTAS